MKRLGPYPLGMVGLVIVVLDCIAPQPARGEPFGYSGHRLVRVQVAVAEDLPRLEALGANIWDCHPRVGAVSASLPAERLAALDQAGFKYAILDDDIGPETEAHRLPGPLRGLTPFDDYMPFPDIVAYINSLEAARPDLCEVIDIGTSVEGRDIWVLHITGPGAGPKPAVFYHGLQHAREWITGPMVMYLADHLVNNYDSDPCIAELVDGTDIYLAPCVNPDGYVHTWGPDRLWRKNRRNNGGSFGVDLNRNWGYQWGFNNTGSSGDGASLVYRGPSPFSEPETQALSNFVTAHPQIRAYMDYHSYSQLILWPWGYDCLTVPEPDATTYSQLGADMRALIAGVHGVNYTAGPICDTLYDANGGSVDWVYGTAGRFGFTIELRPATEPPGFLLPASQIRPTCEENLPAILHLTRSATDGIVMSLPGGAPGEVVAGQPTVIPISISELFDAYVAGSGELNYRLASTAPFSTVPITPAGGGFQAIMPAAPCGATVEYYLTADTAGGGNVRLPGCAAPTATFAALTVGEPVVLTSESFEAASPSWTVGDTGDNATTGLWVRVDPNGTAAQPADDHTPAPGTTCFVTGQGSVGGAVGENDVDGGKTTLKSPNFDLSGAADASIGYWRWYSNNAGAAPGADVFTVDISNDGGGTWTLLEQVGPTGPATGGGWLYAEFQVAAFVTPTSQVRLRFVAADEGSGSIIEAAVDDFQVIRDSCVPLFGDADGDGDVDAADHAYFVECMGGPGAAVPATCRVPHEVFDGDDDLDVDSADFGSLQDGVGQ